MIRFLYIDLFCGAGGTSTGVEAARLHGEQVAKVIACVNHDANAIASHAANHPDALHFVEDIRTLNLDRLLAHVEVSRKQYPAARVVLWASLECTNFSIAKGGQSRDADSRTLAEHLFPLHRRAAPRLYPNRKCQGVHDVGAARGESRRGITWARRLLPAEDKDSRPRQTQAAYHRPRVGPRRNPSR